MTVVGYKGTLGVSAQEGETLGQMWTVRTRGLLMEPETAGTATGNFALFSLYEVWSENIRIGGVLKRTSWLQVQYETHRMLNNIYYQVSDHSWFVCLSLPDFVLCFALSISFTTLQQLKEYLLNKILLCDMQEPLDKLLRCGQKHINCMSDFYYQVIVGACIGTHRIYIKTGGFDILRHMKSLPPPPPPINRTRRFCSSGRREA